MIRVLIVDDSITLRSLLKQVLSEEANIEVVGEASDGIEAIERVRALNPDLVTMDLVMPRLDGMEATRRIMAECPCPILIISAYAETADLTPVFEALKAGALDVVAKPVDAAEWEGGVWSAFIIERIRALIGSQPKPTPSNV